MLTVVLPDGTRHALVGRAAQMVGVILFLEDEITAAISARLELHVGPRPGVRSHWTVSRLHGAGGVVVENVLE